jgi:pimeloyl-ACP methyl ester carboxylesterase
VSEALSDAITEFRVSAGAAELADLRARLVRTRWPEAETVSDWSQGVPLAYLQDLCRYWADGYDWPARQARLNAFPQFRTRIDGLGIHFLHVRSPEPDATPLLITHGWPGSVVEFLDVIAALSDPVAHGGDAADAFHVVCPSLPGYGWSDKPDAPGWGVERIAGAWAQLMERLGYERFVAQGGDWGSAVTTSLAQQHPDRLAGIHLNMVVARPGDDAGELTEREAAGLAALEAHERDGTGYSKQQSTRPQTLGYALVDSPAGQCAWILEKFWAWSDTDGDPVAKLGADRILDNVMVYWLSATAASSARLYWESMRRRSGGPVNVPMGAVVFPKEIFRPSRRWAQRRFSDIRRWSEPDVGGHFAAFEQPVLFVDEVRAFCRLLR